MILDAKYHILDPAGNLTALVQGVKDQNKFVEISRYLISNEKVDQVGFVLHYEKSPSLHMMGGEFCGNALASLACLLYCENQESRNCVTSSGAPGSIDLYCSPISFGTFSATVKIASLRYKIRLITKNMYLVTFPGITHLIIYGTPKDEPQARDLIAKYISDSDSAFGVVFCFRKEQGLSIKPFVFVRSTDTLILEGACASGSLALSIVETIYKGLRANPTMIRQYSNSLIQFNIEDLTSEHVKFSFNVSVKYVKNILLKLDI